MKKVVAALSVMVLVTLLLSAWLPAAAAAPSRTYVKLLNPPKHGVLELAVGESYTFYVEVASEEPYNFAAAKVDQYYPGRGIHAPAGMQPDIFQKRTPWCRASLFLYINPLAHRLMITKISLLN